MGETAVLAAAQRGSDDVVRVLVETGKVDVNDQDKQGDSVLHKACSVGNDAIVRCLLEKGAKIDVKNVAGKTPLDIASMKSHAACIRVLLKQMLNTQDLSAAWKSYVSEKRPYAGASASRLPDILDQTTVENIPYGFIMEFVNNNLPTATNTAPR